MAYSDAVREASISAGSRTAASNCACSFLRRFSSFFSLRRCLSLCFDLSFLRCRFSDRDESDESADALRVRLLPACAQRGQACAQQSCARQLAHLSLAPALLCSGHKLDPAQHGGTLCNDDGWMRKNGLLVIAVRLIILGMLSYRHFVRRWATPSR